MISVVISTKDRREALLRTAGALLAQAPAPGGFELVIVDNGCTDGTADAVRELSAAAAVEVRLTATGGGGGPAEGRNQGVEEAEGDILLFTNDDTAPAAGDLIARHAALHAAHGEATYAVLGRATWTPDEPVTPFMRWLERGIQFGYHRLAPGPVPTTANLCTAHVSLKREIFVTVGGFEERFRDASWEDVELGSRLERQGVVLDYHPELLVHHSHPTTLDSSLERMRRIGRAAAQFHSFDPTWDRREIGPPSGAPWRLARATTPIWERLERTGRLRRAAWRALHMSAYAEGYEQGTKKDAA